MIEKERLSLHSFIPNWVKIEHISRFNYVKKFTKDKIVIDCACGNGTGTAIYGKEAKFVQAFDISKDAIQEATNNCESSNIVFRIGDAVNLPLEDGFADVFISLETIEHLKDDAAYLKEANRVLKKGGTFICSTPNRIVTNPGKEMFDKPANIFHIREYTEKEFVFLLEKYFNTINIVGQNSNHRLKVNLLAFIGKYAPFHIATRIHQFIKLISHPFRRKSYYKVQEKDYIFEYITAVCIK